MKDALGGVQTVLLLGGTSEIGLAIVRSLDLRPDAVVILAGRDATTLQDAAASLAVRTSTAEFDAERVLMHAGLVERVVADHGDLDVVIAAAGILGDEEQGRRDPAVAAQLMQVNFTGLVSVLTAVGARLAAQRHGAIVVLSSIAAVRVRPANYVYGASKAALDAFAGGLREHLRPTGARVLVVRPGFVHSRMTAGRKAPPLASTPEAVGAAVADALRDGDDVVYVPGAVRLVALALRTMPAAVLRRLPL